MQPLPQTYEEVIDLIHHSVRRIHRIARGEYEELLGEANLLFVKAYNSYDPNKDTKFSTWLSYTIAKGLAENKRKEARRNRLLERKEANLETVKDTRSAWKLEEFLDQLSEDALEAVITAAELVESKLSAFHMRQWVVRNLKKAGWGRERIDKAFQEVRTALLGGE